MPQETSSADYKFNLTSSLFGVQVFLVACGGLITVPLLTGLNPNVALFTAGAGTLIFQLLTKRMVPVFLASSFVYIAPLIYGVKTWGIPATMCGLAVAALAYLFLSGLLKWKGKDILGRIFPPVVVGPVIMVIGLLLAPVAVSMALGKADPNHLISQKSALLIAMVSLAATMTVGLLAKGTFKLISLICGIFAGYLAAIPFGIVDFAAVYQAAWIELPQFSFPRWNWNAILFLLPAAIVPAIEHFGDIFAISEVVGKNYFEKPGLQRTLLGNGAAAAFAACLGGAPTSIYAEITGTVAYTRLYNPAIMTWAAILAMALAFIGKLGVFLQTIPVPATGGILILLFGAVLVAGINTLVKSGRELLSFRNLLIVALILVFGIGGMTFSAGAFSFKGVALATVLGIILNLILPDKAADNQV
jgi:uracil permease